MLKDVETLVEINEAAQKKAFKRMLHGRLKTDCPNYKFLGEACRILKTNRDRWRQAAVFIADLLAKNAELERRALAAEAKLDMVHKAVAPDDYLASKGIGNGRSNPLHS